MIDLIFQNYLILQFLEAAQAFTEALDFIEKNVESSETAANSSLGKQIITLINNRSAMYEKGSFPELALEDCNKILEDYDQNHTKARTRKLRILEHFNQYYNALVEVCALQLLYMQQHRHQLRMGIQPATPPPVPQSKLEELVAKQLPEQAKTYEKKLEDRTKAKAELPSDYTLLQLLKSYTGYNSWMAKAAKDGSLATIEKELDALPQDDDSPTSAADRASVMLKKGRRYAYEGNYKACREILLRAFSLVENKPDIYNLMKDDDYARLLEWTGMVKHWTYDLDGATACYQACAELEPINVSTYYVRMP
jgi:tetratricopeptide (TPR) repeat protein